MLRSEIDDKYKWRLEDIYATNDLWEYDLELIEKNVENIAAYKGRLEQSADVLYNALKERDELDSLAEKLFVYARMRRDENNADTVYQGMVDRCGSVMTKVYTQIAFFLPELTGIDEKKVETFFKEKNELEIYRFTFSKIWHDKEHILSDKEEELLTLAGDALSAPDDIFSMFNDADIRFSNIEDETGKSLELTKGKYITFLESPHRNIRKSAFLEMCKSYNDMRNTLAAAYSFNVKTDKFYMTVRKYPSCLKASLDKNNIDVSVYDNLILTIRENLCKLDQYLDVRKRALGIDELHMYDLYVPMIPEFDKKYTFEEAKDIVLKALRPLGEKYIEDLKAAFDSGWIDVCESQGKTSGAYSWGSYLTHPYILLNYQDNINSVFTLAHEIGHAMHSYYSNKTQDYANASYTLFVAEVASTVNESLLINYMLDNTSDPKERAYLLNHYLEEFRGTVFRQVMFAEFEKITHEKIEANEALTTDDLCKIYYDLNTEYFGRKVTVDKEIEIEWARIPHFYRSFYVYQYATGFSAATSLTEGILKNGRENVEKYLNFLSSGGSKYPLDLLKDAGVDLTSPEAVKSGFDKFGDMVGELSGIL